MWPRPAIDQVGIFYDDKNDEATTMTTTQNIHDNRGSHEAKDARKAIESQSVSMIRTHERSKKKRSSNEERSWAKRQYHLQGGGGRECGRVIECGGSA